MFPHVTREVCGLWLQMALCEHSCEPNCSLVHVHYPVSNEVSDVYIHWSGWSIPCHAVRHGLSVPTAEDGTDLWFVALRAIPEGSASAKRTLLLAFIVFLVDL